MIRIHISLTTAVGSVHQRDILHFVGATVPKPDQRGGDHMQNLVASEVDRWVSILKQAGVTPQ
jgi:hypothetical protein